MRERNKKLFLLFALITAMFLFSSPVFALELDYNIGGYSLTNTTSLPEFAKFLFTAAISLGALAALLAMAFGGVYFLVSYNRGSFTSEAKEWIKSGLMGLLIVMCSYLIAYTINPDLVIFRLPGLPQMSANVPSSFIPKIGQKVLIYNTIPIGTIIENTLTKTTSCYDFDPNGNHLVGDEINTDDAGKIFGPTYLDHDRVDCFTKLSDGAQKKAKTFNELSKEIIELMKQCTCKDKCDHTCQGCNPYAGACPVKNPNQAGLCNGDCVGAACKKQDGAIDESCCPPDVKEKIEHGPIKIGGNCSDDKKEYAGLDEFRTSQTGIIADLVEKKVRLEKKEVIVVDLNKWNKLKLVEQLMYFKEKMTSSVSQVNNDIMNLNKAKGIINSSRCYLSTSYVDLMKTTEKVNQQETVILTPNTFSDPNTGEPTSPSKYCKGFNYSNSSCFKKCQDACPDSSQAALSCYKSCDKCDPKAKASDYATCLAKQKECVSKCFGDTRPCVFSNKYKNFGECLSSCQGDCSTQCSKKYLACSDQLIVCNSICSNESTCVMGNKDSCLLNSASFQECGELQDDTGNKKYCINRAYLCKSGSQQYAGYQDCLTPTCNTQYYASSFLGDNPACQKCKNPYQLDANNATCLDIYPETKKCPASSDCPTCQCNSINNTFTFEIPSNTSALPTDMIEMKSIVTNGIGEMNIAQNNLEYSVDVKAFRVVGPECGEYGYDDDPLTFYCEQNWWMNDANKNFTKNPIGKERMCSPDKEVPVGQAVDGAQAWATSFVSSTNVIRNNLNSLIRYITKIGNAKNYCTCSSVFDSGKPICKTDCKFGQQLVPVIGPDGNPVLDPDGNPLNAWQCSCEIRPCEGNPCQQMINYLNSVINYYKQLKMSYVNFFISNVFEPRTDVLKELTYSRGKIGECSLVNNNFDRDGSLFSCQRVENEIMPAINNSKFKIGDKTFNSYCYGKEVGKLLGADMTDNWFCCEKFQTQRQSSGTSK